MPVWSDLAVSVSHAYAGTPMSTGDGRWVAPWFFSTWLIQRGAVDLRRGQDLWSFTSGAVVTMPMGWRRLQRFAPGSEILSCAWRLSWPDGSGVVDFDRPLELSPSPSLLAPMRRLLRPPHDAVEELELRAARAAGAAAWLAQVLAAGANLHQPVQGDERLRRAIAVLAAEPRLGPLPHDHLRSASGLSPVQLDRLALVATGCRLRRLADRLILARIDGLLADPARHLAGIAVELGATDASHLVKWYRRQTGVTPGQARRGGAGIAASSSMLPARRSLP